ncbi:MAG: hypothetical protein QGF74_01625 [Candidatus Nanoarchaeia archaeon]|jgi:hypothetical protein|nr:hypothetical protein [Candidatus Nanoarchaeia archaeon]|tara:strand:- start:24288 stop:24659 length:372 start_codon:yes stop_codon:yes gene_type:complete
MIPLAHYVHPDVLVHWGFNEDNTSLIYSDRNGRSYKVYIGDYHGLNVNNLERKSQIIIASSQDTRGKTEWFFGDIPNMDGEERNGKRNNEFMERLPKILKRKNRVSGGSLYQRLMGVSNSSEE